MSSTDIDLCVFSLAILSIATAQVINSSLRHGQFFCPGMREVVFTCVIHGSERITWTSDEYIRTRIQFVAEVDRPGTRTTENENVYAVFNGSEGQGDSRVLVSELHIVPSQGSVRNPSVQCVDVEGNNNRISFYTIFGKCTTLGMWNAGLLPYKLWYSTDIMYTYSLSGVYKTLGFLFWA